jgi:transcriptional regulator with XRE-family HTH domain
VVPPHRKSKPRTPELAALGEAIRQLRNRAGLSQEQLAERASTDLTQIGGLERGTRNPSYSTLVRVAKALRTRVGEIVTLADQLADGDTSASSTGGRR